MALSSTVDWDPHQHGSAAGLGAEEAGTGGRDYLFHGGLATDAVEHEIRAGHRAAHHAAFGFVLGQRLDRFDRVRAAGIDGVGCTELTGKFELRVIQIDGDDGIRPENAGSHHRRQPNTAHTEDRDTVAGLDPGGIFDCPGTRHDRATDDRGDLFVDIGADFDDILLVRDGVIGPGEHILRQGGAAVGQRQRSRHGSPIGVQDIPGYPGHKHRVALGDVCHVGTCLDHDASGFVSKDDGVLAWVMHLV